MQSMNFGRRNFLTAASCVLMVGCTENDIAQNEARKDCLGNIDQLKELLSAELSEAVHRIKASHISFGARFSERQESKLIIDIIEGLLSPNPPLSAFQVADIERQQDNFELFEYMRRQNSAIFGTATSAFYWRVVIVCESFTESELNSKKVVVVFLSSPVYDDV